MARFTRPSVERDTIHADWWDEGELPDGTKWREEVLLKPYVSAGTVQKASKSGLNIPNDITEEQFSNATPMQMVQWTNQAEINASLMMEQIVSWTFRFEPNEEQEEAGIPGDLVPLSKSAVEELTADDALYIVGEINKRTGGRKKEAEAQKPQFRSDLPVDTTAEGR